jgi:hypothetical protein
VDAPDQKIVTLASLQRPSSAVEDAGESEEAQTPEDRMKEARFEQIMERLQDATDGVGDDVVITVQDREVSVAQSRIAQLATESRELTSGGQEVQFGTGLAGGDWFRWMMSLMDWVGRGVAHPMVRPKGATAESVDGDLRVAMTADWATGLYGAPHIAATIAGMGAERPFDLLMHLGDVYYSGTPEEVNERFLALWPRGAGIRNRALNGNHDMYSGGFGYYDEILPAFGQDGSYFAVQNEHWVLVGLDTAYIDHDLDTTQVAWLNLVLEQADLERRKAVLFSHQQPFSRLSSQGPKLQNALKHWLADRAITAWYWGHEHQCVIYDRHEEWGLYGRCLGNGGVPDPRRAEVKAADADERYPGALDCAWRRLDATDHAPACMVLDGPNMNFTKRSHQERFGPHGFMTLTFSGPELVERVYLSDGTELYENTIA